MVAAVLLGDVGLIVLNVLWGATLQQLVPDGALSRVSSYDLMVSLVATPAGYFLTSRLAEQVGETQTLALGAALILGPCLLLMTVSAVRAVRMAPDGRIIYAATVLPAQQPG